MKLNNNIQNSRIDSFTNVMGQNVEFWNLILGGNMCNFES